MIDGIKLYKLEECDYEDILKSDIQSAVSTLTEITKDSQLASFESIIVEINEKIEAALNAATTEEMENSLKLLNEYIEKIKSLLPVAENILSLKNEANEILNTSDPYIGYDIFKDKYNDIIDKLKDLDLDEVISAVGKSDAAQGALKKVATSIFGKLFGK